MITPKKPRNVLSFSPASFSCTFVQCHRCICPLDHEEREKKPQRSLIMLVWQYNFSVEARAKRCVRIASFWKRIFPNKAFMHPRQYHRWDTVTASAGSSRTIHTPVRLYTLRSDYTHVGYVRKNRLPNGSHAFTPDPSVRLLRPLVTRAPNMQYKN